MRFDHCLVYIFRAIIRSRLTGYRYPNRNRDLLDCNTQ